MRNSSSERFQQSWKSFNKAWKWYWKVWEGLKYLPEALRETIKWIWEWYDGINKKIWEVIEKKNIEKWKDTTGKIKTH